MLNIKVSRIVLLILWIVLLDFAAGRYLTFSRSRQNELSVATTGRFLRKTKPYHHELRPMNTAECNGTVCVTNSLGFRDSAMRNIELTSSLRRILFLGDSFTEGVSVSYEKTFVGRIDNALRPRGIEVLNGAARSYSPVIHWIKAKYLLETLGLRVDEVVVFLDISDSYDEIKRYSLNDNGEVLASLNTEMEFGLASENSAESLPVKESKPFSQILKENSSCFFAAALLRSYWRGYTPVPQILGGTGLLLHSGAAWTVDPERMYEFGRDGLLSGKKYMTLLAGLAKTLNIKMAIAVYPYPHQIAHNDLDSIQVKFWSKWADEHAVHFINYFPHFVDGRPWQQIHKKYFLPGDVHWNEAGHALVADVFLADYDTVLAAQRNNTAAGMIFLGADAANP